MDLPPSTSKRSQNFTNAEKLILCKLIKNKKKMIENKRADRITMKQKEIAWNSICKEFNSQGQFKRRLTILKAKYNDMKKVLRKKISTHRQNGGGPLDLEASDEILFSIINPSSAGMEIRFVGDSVEVIYEYIFK